MADPSEVVDSVLPSGNAPGGPAAPDPRDVELAELRQYREAAARTLEALAPYEDDIRAIVEDEEYRGFNRTAREQYLDLRRKREEAQKPAIDPAVQAAADVFYERVKPSLEFVDKLRERESPEYQERQRAEAATREFVSKETEYTERLKAEHGLTDEQIRDIAVYAGALHKRTVDAGSPRFVPLEEAWRKMQGFAAPRVAPSTPRSMRAHSATPGIPGGSRPPEPDRAKKYEPGDLTARVRARLQKGA